ncbi:MAG: dehydrogenase [Paludibacteraceae bacterium]|nr:dehydrogenase [Paludibacteraceae bacterium]
MADNYLENKYEEYLRKKAEWEKKRQKTKIHKTS